MSDEDLGVVAMSEEEFLDFVGQFWLRSAVPAELLMRVAKVGYVLEQLQAAAKGEA